MDEAGSRVWDRANMGRPIVNNGDYFTIGNFHCVAVRLLLGEFLELQACRTGLGLARGVNSRPSNAALLPRDRGQICSLF